MRTSALSICKNKGTDQLGGNRGADKRLLVRFGHENIATAILPFLLFKKSSCQLMVKECELSTGKLPLVGLPRNSVITDHPGLTSSGYRGSKSINQNS